MPPVPSGQSMGRLRLLPGERELVRLRPALAAWFGHYLLALGFVAWAGVLDIFGRMQWYEGLIDSTAGQIVALLVIIPAGPILVAGALYIHRRRWMRFALSCVAAAAAVALVVRLPGPDARALWMGYGAASGVALILAEVDRRLRAYHLTNVRILYLGGLWAKTTWTVHYDSILDLDVRRSPMGRLFGYGSIDPILSHPPEIAPPTRRRKNAVQAIVDTSRVTPSVAGVGRLRVVRFLLEAFVKDATANEYLRAEQQTQKRVGDALRALGSANVLPQRR